MALELGVWKIERNNKDFSISKLDGKDSVDYEKNLEDYIEQNIELICPPKLMLIGRQIVTDDGKKIDILAVDSSLKIHVIELKRGKTPYHTIGQILHYGSWVHKLNYEEVVDIYKKIGDGILRVPIQNILICL